MQKKATNDLEGQKTSFQDYAKYSGIAFQMIAIVMIGVWGGIQLDKLFNMQKPVFTIILILLAAVLAIYNLFRTLLK